MDYFILFFLDLCKRSFEDETGQVKLVEAQALASLFNLFADQIECVVLNACYSEVQAKAIAEHISYVVGMSKAIGDKAAIEFAVGFYDALGAGRTVEFAYKLGCNSIEIAGISEHLTPQLLSNSDILTNKVSSQAEVNPSGEPSTKYNQKQTEIDQLDSELKEKEMPSIFICYSHRDEIWRDRLLEFLQSLNFEKQIVWSDLDLEQGDIWDEKIKEVLPKVTVAVVLVSQAILNSTYVRNEELPRLLQRFEDKEVRIIPLFVKYADVENVPFHYTNEQGESKTFYLNQAQSPRNNSPRNPLYILPEAEQDKVLLSVVQNLRSLIDKKKKIEVPSDSVLEEVTQRSKASISHDNFINRNSLDFDNARLYLSIKLKKVSSQSNNSESEKFSVDTKVSIPQSSTDYQQENLLETFQENAPYTQTEIEENIPNLLEECYQKLEEIGFDQDIHLAIEWVFDDDLFSLDVDCWKFKENEFCRSKRIGCASFESVHIRSYRRLKTKRCLDIWKKKWDWLTENANRMNINNYIFASQTNDRNDNDLKVMDSQQMIFGINLPTDLLRLENISYEFIIERGIPLALWSRCQNSAVNHTSDLDELIKPKKDNEENLKDGEDNVLNLENLTKSVEVKRLEATEEEPFHLGHHLCFLWENPYNYPTSKKLKL